MNKRKKRIRKKAMAYNGSRSCNNSRFFFIEFCFLFSLLFFFLSVFWVISFFELSLSLLHTFKTLNIKCYASSSLNASLFVHSSASFFSCIYFSKDPKKRFLYNSFLFLFLNTYLLFFFKSE